MALKWYRYFFGMVSEWYRNDFGLFSGVFLGVCFFCVFGWVFLGVWGGVFVGRGGVFGCLFIFLVKGVSSPLQHAT